MSLCTGFASSLEDWGVPGFEGGSFAFLGEDRQSRGGQDEMSPEARLHVEPTRRDHTQDVTVREHEHVTVD